MTAAEFDADILSPALTWFRQHCPEVPVTRNAHVLLLAIAGEESSWEYRVQGGNGPAHSFWQMERMGGVAGVLTHHAVAGFAQRLCALVPVDPSPHAVWGLFATEKGDNLAAAFARLLLWTDPGPLPDDADGGWETYVKNWRPGKPRRGAWDAIYEQADAAVPIGDQS